MESGMKRWYDAVPKRYSVRKYEAGPSLEQMLSLEQMAEALSTRGVRIAVAVEERAFQGLAGSRIKGTTALAAILSKGAEPFAPGYIGEAFLLECTAMGLGTCWLGASFNRGGVYGAIRLNEGEKLHCVTPIGVPGEPFVRRPRKSIEELTWLAEDEFEALPQWQREAIACARLSPSAINAQPWEFLPTGEGIAVKRTSRNFGFGALDCGIAMLHIELGAAHAGVTGSWHMRKEGQTFLPEG